MEWNKLDRFIAEIRYRKIDKYIKNSATICDIGCGRNADFLKRYSRKIKKGYGFDFRINDEIIGNIELYNNKNRGVLPIPDNSCDTVFMLALIEHLDAPRAVLKESHRILNTDGILVLTTPARLAKPVLEFMAFRLHIINEDEIAEHKHYYSKKELIALLEQTGFTDIHYRKFCFGMNSMCVAKYRR